MSSRDLIMAAAGSTPAGWDLSEATFEGALPYFWVGGQETEPLSVQFSTDGTKMYVLGSVFDRVYQYTLSTAWDISTVTYSGLSLSVFAQDSVPNSVQFSGDGTMMFIIGQATDNVFQYTLSTAWDISTASYASKSFNTTAQDGAPVELFFKPDGTAMYILGDVNNTVFQYTLGTAWDISTASYASKSFSVAALETSPHGLYFKPDGTVMYVVGESRDNVLQYTLSTAWDVSTASYSGKSWAVNLQDGRPTGVAFRSDGTSMYVIAAVTDVVYQYPLSVAWDISTASFAPQGPSYFYVRYGDPFPTDVAFNDDGTKMYVLGDGFDVVHQYTLGIAWDISTAFATGKLCVVSAQDQNPNGLCFKPDGTAMYVVGGVSDSIYQYTLTTAWDISTAKYANLSFSIAAQEGNAQGVQLSTDGTKMYILGTTNDTVYQYTLSTAWDISTASYASKSFSVAIRDGTPYGLAFKPDGSRMYMVGIATDSVYQFTLNAPWDVSTAVFAFAFSVAGQDTQAHGLYFKPDGTVMYVIGSANGYCYQYGLGVAWSINTASYTSKRARVAMPDTALSGIALSSDGTAMFIVGSGSDAVYQYTLSTAWDIGSAYFLCRSVSIASQETTPTAFAFSTDGTKMYVVGTTNDTVYQYTLSTAWDISIVTYSGLSLSITARDTQPAGLYLSSDGLRLYVLGGTTMAVYQYTLGTAWSINTAVYQGRSVSIRAETATPSGILFNPAGTKMYITGANSSPVWQYTLPSAWTLPVAPTFISVSARDATPQDVRFNPDGTVMYIVGSATDAVYQFTLSTAWDVTTAVYASKSFSVATQDSTPSALFFSSDGTIMFVLGANNWVVYQYTLSTAWDISTASYASKSFNVGSQTFSPYGLFFSTDGTYMYVGGSRVFWYTLSTAWDISTAAYTGSSFIPPAPPEIVGTQAFAVSFSPTGTTMFIGSPGNDFIAQYTLSTAWNVTTAVYANRRLAVATQDTELSGLTFSSDGTKMFMSGSTNDRVWQFSLDSPWELNDYSLVQYSAQPLDRAISDLAARPDGTRLYLLGDTLDTVYQISM